LGLAAPAQIAGRDAVATQLLSSDAEEFLSYLAVEKGRAPASLSAYRRDLRAYEEFLTVRGVPVQGATAQVVEDYLAFLAASGRRPTSNARALAAIRGLHRFCVDERGAGLDPTDGVNGPRLPQPIPKALSEAEVELLLSAVVGDDGKARRDRAILELLYATGMRISELAGLRLQDLDRERRLAIVFGKGSKERVVPYGRHAAEALAAWLGPGGRASLAPARWARRTDEEALFVSRRGHRMTRQSVWVVVNAAAKKVRLDTTRSPRTSFATRALPTCSNTGPTSGLCRSFSATRPSPPRRCTRR
jgi:integrase/recombinase XerD